jgi:integrase
LADLPIASIGTEDVLRLLQPLWLAKPGRTRRLQRRVEKLFDWSRARGYRQGENPARWRGHLATLLPKQSGTQRHYAAMPYQDIPAFLTVIRAMRGYGARGLELLILTATRSAEVIGSRWDEFDLERREWTIPAQRMKSRREHRIPLSDAAIAVLTELQAIRRGGFVLPSYSADRHASHAVLDRVLKLIRRDCTVHGFRSSFRDWAAERTMIDPTIAEMALAHQVGTATERAYLRSDQFARRADLMQRWADYCMGSLGDNVVSLRR